MFYPIDFPHDLPQVPKNPPVSRNRHPTTGEGSGLWKYVQQEGSGAVPPARARATWRTWWSCGMANGPPNGPCEWGK
jgi:hypothetical protein